jgi:hypothetical protein
MKSFQEMTIVGTHSTAVADLSAQFPKWRGLTHAPSGDALDGAARHQRHRAFSAMIAPT